MEQPGYVLVEAEHAYEVAVPEVRTEASLIPKQLLKLRITAVLGMNAFDRDSLREPIYTYRPTAIHNAHPAAADAGPKKIRTELPFELVRWPGHVRGHSTRWARRPISP